MLRKLLTPLNLNLENVVLEIKNQETISYLHLERGIECKMIFIMVNLETVSTNNQKLEDFTICSICAKIVDWWKGEKKDNAQEEQIANQKENWGDIHKDFDEVKQWKNWNFSATETKTWLEVGLDKYDWEFAFWLKTKRYTPKLIKNNLEQVRSNYNQCWLTKYYPNHNIEKLDIYKKNLKGELNLSQYQQLESLVCSNNNLTNIILPTNPTSLKYLNLQNNNFNQDLSFLVPFINLEGLYLENNKFTGSLDYLSGMEQLSWLNINNTDLNEVNIEQLPRSLKEIKCSTNGRPDCKLTAIVPLLEPVRYGWCEKCKEFNNSYEWCQLCANKEWQVDIKQLTDQALINKFIEQRPINRLGGKSKLQWIPYEQFTDIEHIADGGFSKIYKTKWERRKEYWESDYVVLKSLNNSKNIAFEFLTEIANTKLVGSKVVNCYGISQDPETKNYLMVMEYKKDGNLRQYLQNKNGELSLEYKLKRLNFIADGLSNIHEQNLVHQDFHSGNILSSSITDLGLSRPVDYQKQESEIFGVLPYVAPEVLQGQPYTKASDIYSFGIIAYELLANAYPYPDLDYLGLRVCQGLRPNLDKVPLPQLLKDLIKSCWDSNPDKRPKAEKWRKIVGNWKKEIYYKENTPFHQQYLEIEAEYNILSKKPYQIHPNATLTSKPINTKEITEKLTEFSKSVEFSMTELQEVLEENNNHDWTDIHPNFTDELIQKWQKCNFTFEQCRDWINADLKPTDANFCAWLQDTKQLILEQVLNHFNEQELRQEYQTYQQLQSNIEQSLK